MATEIIMPKAGMAMESGTIIQWYKKPGEFVEAGEPLLEIETDKVAMEVESETSGFVLDILYGEGDEVPVITTIGYLGEKEEASPRGSAPLRGERPGTARADGDPSSATGVPAETVRIEGTDGGIPATPAARRKATELGVDLANVSPSGKWGEVRGSDVEAYGQNAPRVSHLARKIADAEGIDLAGVVGSGPGGRIVKRDISRRPNVGIDSDPSRLPLRGMRRTIAQRMTASHHAVPPVTLNRKVIVDELLALNAKVKRDDNTESSEGVRISITDILVKAVAKALADAPYMRSSIDGEYIEITDKIDIGIAVALDEGLLVPVIRNVPARTLSEIAAIRSDLVGRARNRGLVPDELRGATFTITNLGMYGISSFTPIVNTPESGILGVNAIEERLALDEEGGIRVLKEMTLSLTIDHRVVDGAQGALFLGSLAKLIENPVQIFI